MSGLVKSRYFGLGSFTKVGSCDVTFVLLKILAPSLYLQFSTHKDIPNVIHISVYNLEV